MVPVHSEEVLFDVIRSVELLLTDVALEWFLVSVDVFVPREEISPVCCVRAESAAVSLAGSVFASSGLGRRPRRRRILRLSVILRRSDEFSLQIGMRR